MIASVATPAAPVFAYTGDEVTSDPDYDDSQDDPDDSQDAGNVVDNASSDDPPLFGALGVSAPTPVPVPIANKPPPAYTPFSVSNPPPLIGGPGGTGGAYVPDYYGEINAAGVWQSSVYTAQPSAQAGYEIVAVPGGWVYEYSDA